MPVKIITSSSEILQVRKIPYLPDDLELVPDFPQRLTLGTHIQNTLSKLHGQFKQGGKLIKATQDGELRVATGDNIIDTYTVITGTLPSSFGSSCQILTTKIYPNWMIDVEGDALIRFRNRDGATWMDEFRVLNGIFPIGIKATGIQAKSVAGANETFYITAFGEE